MLIFLASASKGEITLLNFSGEAVAIATVGRFERVFEMGKNFRNEGSDPSHMQEFSVFEHYAAYWNFEDNMKFTEDMTIRKVIVVPGKLVNIVAN